MMNIPIMITADEVNCLIHSYFQDSGFQHSAFALRAEGRLEHSPFFVKHVPRGQLVELLSKALLYVEVEAHWRADAMTANCKTEFSLLAPHVCSLEPPIVSDIPTRPPAAEKSSEAGLSNGTMDSTSKRKSSTPLTDERRVEKRQKKDKEIDVHSPEPPPAPALSQSPAPKPAKADPLITANDGISLPKETPQDGRGQESALATVPPHFGAVSILKGHKKEVFNCAWNPTNHQLLASGCKDGVISLWDLPQPQNGETLTCDPMVSITEFSNAKDADVTALHWSPDGSFLAVGCYDSILRVCTPTGKIHYSGSRHKAPIFAVRFSKNSRWILTASLDGLACVWDVERNALFKHWQCHQDCVLDVEWLDDTTFATCGSDALIHIMNFSGKKPIKTLAGHTEGFDLNQIKCNVSRTRLASCSDDQTVRIWNVSPANLTTRSPDAIPGLTSSEPVMVLRGHTNAVCGLAWCSKSPLGPHELLASASFDKTVRLWDTVTGDLLTTFADHKQPVYTLTFSPDGRHLVSGGGDGAIHIYDVKQMKRVWTWSASPGTPGIYEADWQIVGGFNRIALVMENHEVAIIDISQIPDIQAS